MNPTTEAADGGSEQAPVAVVAVEGDGKLSVIDAARALAGARSRQQRDQQETATEQRSDQGAQQGAEGSTAHTRLALGSDRGPALGSDRGLEAEAGAGDAASRSRESGEAETRGETERADPGAQEDNQARPPIEPPRSWTKEDKELFTSLPRETQERIAERERSRESDFLRRQNEAADKLKGLTVKEQAVDQVRQQYETALPQLLTMLQQQQAGEFADIKTLADVERMAREDWPRYALWDVQQKKIAEVARQLSEVQQRQGHEKLRQFQEFAKREDDLFTEKVPDMADAKKAAELQTRCLATLTGMGFAEAELAQSWNGAKDLSLRDHRVQLLIRDATLWREAQAKAKAAQARPVPPVQRPGTAPGRGEGKAAEIQNLATQLDKSSGVKALRAAARLVATRRASR